MLTGFNTRNFKVHSIVKVAFIQKGLMRLSFLQSDEPNLFPEIEV